MRVFTHHLHEYKKGLRTLVLHTTNARNRDTIEKRLERAEIEYYIQVVSETKINVFFGNPICIEVIKQMNLESLSSLTDEEDFILGTMLGYDRVKQCERYLKKKRSGSINNLEKVGCKLKTVSRPQTDAISVVG
ncbi:MAG: hypothetical protein C5S38_04925 [Candidatus Methanophagaceae archaeon]|nr:MAG: hypothetical protein C5S38_04925 [Methanophagales archaeon]KAF5432568.1 Protein of unknown function (DUF2023) [Methanophagales archaeon]